MEQEEKKVICCNALIAWIQAEQKNNAVRNDKDILDLFTSKIIIKKFKTFGIDIILPDMLLLILNVCVDGNPGIFQVILKDLLNSIKKHKGSIPSGYTITTEDFVNCFRNDFPIIDIKYVYDKYEKLWNEQKKEVESYSFDSNNLCDTIDWWKEVMG